MLSVATREARVAPEEADIRPALPLRPDVGVLSEGRVAISWSEQYRHPLWQKKRLEAMTAADFVCQHCFDGETQLHVHHKRYVKGRMVWEYEINELEVLCEPCHEEAHAMKDVLHDVISGVHPMMAPWREAAAVVAGFYCHESGVRERVDLQALFDQAPFQFTLGVIAGALHWGDGARKSSSVIGAALSDVRMSEERWDWIGKGITFLREVEDRPIASGTAEDATP